MPVRVRARVVFPPPEGPVRRRRSPGPMVRFTPSRRRVSPTRTPTPAAHTVRSAAGSPALPTLGPAGNGILVPAAARGGITAPPPRTVPPRGPGPPGEGPARLPATGAPSPPGVGVPPKEGRLGYGPVPGPGPAATPRRTPPGR